MGGNMEEKKIFEDPEVTTFDRDELDLKTAQTAAPRSDFPDN